MCERLANATKELLTVHQKLYEQDINAPPHNSYQLFDSTKTQDIKMNYDNRSPIISRSPSSHSSSSVTMSPIPINNTNQPPLSSLLGTTTTSSEPSIIPPYQQQQQHLHDSFKNSNNSHYLVPSTPPSSTVSNTEQQQQQQRYANQQKQQTQEQSSALAFNWNRGNEIDFNSLEFLYDTGLFGQVIFDVNSNSNTVPPSIGYSTQQSIYQPILSSQPYITPPTSSSQNNSPTPPSATSNASAFQPMITQQHQQQQNSPSTYNPSKSLWN